MNQCELCGEYGHIKNINIALMPITICQQCRVSYVKRILNFPRETRNKDIVLPNNSYEDEFVIDSSDLDDELFERLRHKKKREYKTIACACRRRIRSDSMNRHLKSKCHKERMELIK